MHICVTCGKEYTPKQPHQKYCSLYCRAHRKRKAKPKKQIQRTCEFCGQSFAGPDGKRFCSALCRQHARIKAKSTERICPVCGASFRGYGRQRYCSKTCQQQVHYESKNKGRRKPQVKKVCPICNNTFKTASPQKLYCSPKCRQKAQIAKAKIRNNTPILHLCERCGAEFFGNPRMRFCSDECRLASHKEKTSKSITLTCEYCGCQFERPPAHIMPGRQYCSKECHDEDQRDPTTWVARICEFCGEEFETRIWQIDYRGNGGKYCSNDCKHAAMSITHTAEGNPNWTGGHSQYVYYGPNWHSQRRKALKRDDYTCQVCGATDYLHVHHIKPFATFNYITGYNDNYLKANRLSNLVTLCQCCHKPVECGLIDLPVF